MRLEKPPQVQSNIDIAPVEMYEEARRYFMGKGRLNKTLARITIDVRPKFLELQDAVSKSELIQEK